MEKAFDTVVQSNMGELIMRKVALEGGMPWDKTQCICAAAFEGTVTVGDKQVDIGGPDCMIKVLGANFSLGGGGSRHHRLHATKSQSSLAMLTATSFWLGGNGRRLFP